MFGLENTSPDFGDKYAACSIEKAKKAGATDAQILAQTKEMTEFKEMYKKPLVNIAFTFLEPLPVGLIFTLVSAGVLSRKRGAAGLAAQQKKSTRYVSSRNQQQEKTMKRVTGIGGIFFNSSDPVRLRAWYKDHLGIDVQVWGGTAFSWADSEGKPMAGTTIWTVGDAATNSFTPSAAPFMINYRVADLYALVAALKAEGCNVLDKIDESEYGKFAWVIDPDGNKVELWEPPDGQ